MLDEAPECGACSYLDTPWSTSSRFISPGMIGDALQYNQLYTGLDYMLLHNLKYIGYHWPEYDDVIAEPNYGYEYVTLTGGDIYSESNIEYANVEFLASRSIVLQPGFQVKDASFLADVGPIGSGYQATYYEKKNVSQCLLPPFGSKKSLINNDSNEEVLTSKIESKYYEETMNMDYVISFYPNPVHKTLNIEINNLYEMPQMQIIIFNLYGQIVLDNQFIGFENEAINVSNLTSGIYFARIIIEERISNFKFIKI